MKRKLVKRPLLAYASGKKGDVYGYDWSWRQLLTPGCVISVVGAVGGTALFLTGAGGVAGAMITSAAIHSVPFSCF